MSSQCPPSLYANGGMLVLLEVMIAFWHYAMVKIASESDLWGYLVREECASFVTHSDQNHVM
jgi:hypothetical protein